VARVFGQIWQDETGQNMVEYAVLLALILILVVGSVTLIGSTFLR